MQPYERGVRVHVGDGWHDKIEVLARGWSIQDDPDLRGGASDSAFAMLIFDRIASAGNEHRSGSQAHVHSLILNRPRGEHRGTRCTLLIRSRPARLIPNHSALPAPLFGGQMIAYVDRQEEARERRVVGFANLKLNPTRYARHQIWPGNRPRARPHLRPYESLFRYPLRPVADGEHSLVDEGEGDDNWIPLAVSGELSMTTEQAAQLRCNYFQTVFDCISDEVNRVAASLNLEAVNPPFNFKFGTVETFWEFAFDEPLSLVESFARSAQGFARMTNRHYADRVETGARVLQFKMRAGVTLRVYAKTNRRVRLEVEHDFSKLRGSHTLPRQHGSVEAVENALEMVRTQAAMIVNEFLAHCDRLAVRPAELRSPVSLIVAIIDAAQNVETAREILEVLCSNGCVMTLKDSPINAAIKRLRETHVLENRPHSRVYRPTARFEFAIARLREEGRLPMFFDTPFPIRRARPTLAPL